MHRFAIVSGSVFAVVAGAWALRLIMAMPIVVNGYSIPNWFSAIPLAVTGALAIWAFRLARTSRA